MSFFIIRGGYFGFEFTIKIFWILLALTACIYDWKKNKRKDYFWVFLVGSLFYIGAEVGMYLSGARVFTDRFIFGLDVTSLVWLTIPIQAIADVPALVVICLFIGDRLLNKDTRKNGLILAALYVGLKNVVITVVLVSLGYNYNNISVGDPTIYSRRDIFDLVTIFSITGLFVITLVWFILTNKEARKRTLYLFAMIVVFMILWTVGEWLAGQRWIEVASGMTYVKPSGIAEFGILAYDIVFEMGIFGISFLSIPYLVRLIKTKKEVKESK